ncbi:MAG: hypothetical protein ABGY09_00765 [Euryarchaeota archaeon]
MRTVPILLAALALTLSGVVVADEDELAGVLVHPWALQLSASQPKEVSKEYVISVEGPAGSNLPLRKAYYGVFVSDEHHAALIVDLTPAVVGEKEDKVIIDPNAIPGRQYARVRFKHAHAPRYGLLALSLETKPLPLGLPVKLVKPEDLKLKVGRVEVKLDEELARDLARVLATYEYGEVTEHISVGKLQALVFKVLVRDQLLGIPKVEKKSKKKLSQAESPASVERTEVEKKVNEEAGYAVRAFLEANAGRSEVRAEFEAAGLEDVLGEAAKLVEDFLSSKEGKELVSAAERAAKAGAAAAPVALAAVLSGLLALARRR